MYPEAAASRLEPGCQRLVECIRVWYNQRGPVHGSMVVPRADPSILVLCLQKSSVERYFEASLIESESLKYIGLAANKRQETFRDCISGASLLAGRWRAPST